MVIRWLVSYQYGRIYIYIYAVIYISSSSSIVACHSECMDGCTGPTALECVACAHAQLDSGECASECPSGKVPDSQTKSCTGYSYRYVML
ncbi:hypothetical protein E6Q11_05980 [Candidatus Dojkabacteria bacterium]|uniref:Furin-like cysteine-rich domain-containing protein n=1 Tax=Candidatus Dojkabacteria bacterium TaxID=2099670 RepID=A0A5C7J4T2_9BACT|nr:MAG: hypothetical protein E6Q11_05980 [Candidatus Dojkabacteria bacterium]